MVYDSELTDKDYRKLKWSKKKSHKVSKDKDYQCSKKSVYDDNCDDEDIDLYADIENSEDWE